MRVIATRYGARLVQGRSYLSKVLRKPGPTGEVFDVLAAAMSLAPHGTAAVLGFAGGSVLAPLRAMGDRRPVRAVDLDRSGHAVFRRLCSSWAGDVRVDTADAVAWLRASRRRWSLVVEDLSTDGTSGATKPRVSVDEVPGVVRRRLAAGGWLVVNLLPIAGLSGSVAVRQVSAGLPDVVKVTMRDHENVVLVAARRLPGARELARALREALLRIGSPQARKIGVRRQNTRR
jgi:hypothetical protein